MMRDTTQVLREIVGEFLHLPASQVPCDAALVADLGLDSFAMMDLILTIEERFPGFDFAAPEVGGITTLRQLADRLDRR